MIKRKKILYLGLLTFLFVPMLARGQSNASEEEASAMIRQIYKDVSSDGTSLPDWDRVRSYFVDEAVVVLRTSKEASSQFTLEEFIEDFRNFYRSPALADYGFNEEVIQLKSSVYHDIAFIAVVYEAGLTGGGRPPQQGIDLWLLARKEGAWKVVSVVNEIIRPGEVLPPPFD